MFISSGCNCFVISHLNVPSLFPKLLDFKFYIVDKKIDILAVSEIWLSDRNGLMANNYNLIRKDMLHVAELLFVLERDLKFDLVSVSKEIEQIDMKISVKINTVNKPRNSAFKDFIGNIRNSLVKILKKPSGSV